MGEERRGDWPDDPAEVTDVSEFGELFEQLASTQE